MQSNNQSTDDLMREALSDMDENDLDSLRADPDAFLATFKLRKEMLKAVEKYQRDTIPPIVRAECRATMEEVGDQLREQLIESLRPVLRQEVFDGISNNLPLPQTIEVRSPRKKPRIIKPPFHSSLPLIIQLASARASGFPVPLWIHGPKGVGKSEIARQVARSLGVPFHLIALSPNTSEGKLVGFRNAATGAYMPGLLNEPYAHGGLAFLDEIDIADPGLLVGLNSVLSGEDYLFPDGKVVKRHPNFFLMAGANTIGTGATGGYLRRNMDAAVLDRFQPVPVPFDPQLEMAISGNRRWVEYVQKLRAAVEKLGVRNFEISTRSTLRGAAFLEAGIRPAQVIELLLAKAGKATAQSILNEVGPFNPR